ncbi:MAG: helix-turn-helix domain-containing protein [Bifidobacteriaceae bacterium]|nr:helix-turn-helix domain-containing protein [Bifidobacteriaceae bacterium]
MSALTERGTASESIASPTRSETKLMAAQLTEEVGGDRGEVRVLHERYDDLHQRIHDVEWRIATAERAKASVTAMLSELADLGFSWREIARLVHVSVPAVQKWRKGEKASGESRQRLASLLAACDLIMGHYLVEEIASWFEMPLSSAAPVTPIDLYSADRADLVFEFGSSHVDPEALLAQFDPGWRDRYRSDFEVFEAGDGNRSLRTKA